MLKNICELLALGFLNVSEAAAKGEEALMAFWKGFAAKVLALIPAGMYGTELHGEMCRMNRQISVVFALIRGEGVETEVLMRLRKGTEPYGGQYCLEANNCLPYETEQNLIERMLKKLGVSATSIVHFSPADFSIREERGCEWKHCVYGVEVDGEAQLLDGRVWVKVSDLPENVVHHHMIALKTALSYRYNKALFHASVARMNKALGLTV